MPRERSRISAWHAVVAIPPQNTKVKRIGVTNAKIDHVLFSRRCKLEVMKLSSEQCIIGTDLLHQMDYSIMFDQFVKKS